MLLFHPQMRRLLLLFCPLCFCGNGLISTRVVAAWTVVATKTTRRPHRGLAPGWSSSLSPSRHDHSYCCFHDSSSTRREHVRLYGTDGGTTNPPSPPTSLDDEDSEGDNCSLEDETASECLASVGGYARTTTSFAMVTEVYVAEIESLRDRFESYESGGNKNDSEGGGTNAMRFNKRKLRGHHILKNNYNAPPPAAITSNGLYGPRRANNLPKENGVVSAPSPPRDDNGIKNNKVKNNDDDHTAPDQRMVSSHVANLEYNALISKREMVLADAVRKPGMNSLSRAFYRAGPRKLLHFNPSEVNAAIVTCGGLCPGLNNVIRELVHSLYYLYGARRVYGILGGFHGFHKPEYLPPIVLTNEIVENIHHEGGTVLRSSRGGFDENKILDFLRQYDISQLYLIGGDGTHRGAYKIHRACVERGLNVAVAGIPKTIDNDVDYIDRSFGFQSAVEASQLAIRTAKTEAMCNVPNGIGMIKLMGRHAGFLAAFAAVASGDADLVLVPEVPIVLEGTDGILPFLRNRVREQGYAVVVIAEGAGEDLLGASASSEEDVVDDGGNRALPQIAEFLQKATKKYFARLDETCTIKYIDPSYTVRSVPANAADSLYCQQLAADAVHGCMAGLTGFSVGVVNKCPAYIPIPLLVATSPRNLDPEGTTWERILCMTGQPSPSSSKQRHQKQRHQTDDDDASIVVEDDFGIGSMPSGIPEPTVH